jgi:hypothetical protein
LDYRDEEGYSSTLFPRKVISVFPVLLREVVCMQETCDDNQ